MSFQSTKYLKQLTGTFYRQYTTIITQNLYKRNFQGIAKSLSFFDFREKI